MNVKLIRMWSGEDVIADLTGDNDDTITVVNPIVAIPAGQGQMGFAPWSPLLKGKGEEIEVKKSYVVYVADTQEEIVDQYTQMFSTIATPPSKKIIL